MTMLRPLSYRAKLVLMVMTVAGLAVVTTSLGVVFSNYVEARSSIQRYMTTMADLVAENTRAAIDFDDNEAAAETLQALQVDSNIVAAQIMLRKSGLFAEYINIEHAEFDCAPSAKQQCEKCEAGSIIIKREIDLDGVNVGSVFIQYDTCPLRASLMKATRNASIVMLVAFGLAFLLAARLQRGVAGPVLHLAETAQQVTRLKDYSIRATRCSDDDLGRLTDSFNGMLERIEERNAALSAARDELERRVEQRTNELKRSKEKAEGIAIALRDKNAMGELLHEIAVDANEASDTNKVLQKVVDLLPVYTGWQVGHVYLPSAEESAVLEPTTIWYFEDADRFQIFREVTERTTFGKGKGLPGRVWTAGRPAWITNVKEDDDFPRAELADELGIHGAFALPILIGDEVVAVLEFFTEHEVKPDKGLMELCGHIGAQLGRVFERRRAQEGLQEQEQRTRQILQATADAVVTFDDRGKIQTFNRAAEKIFGYRAEAMIGNDVSRLMPLLQDQHDDDSLLRFARTGKSETIGADHEVMGRRDDGTIFPLVLAVAEIRHKGQRLFVACAQDVTERAEMQQQLLAASRQAGMAEVATDVLHNVGNVLNSVNVSASIVLDKIKSRAGGDLLRLAELLQEHSGDLADFLDSDERGRHITRYLGELGREITTEQTSVLDELDSLSRNVEHIKDIVATQQEHAKTIDLKESVNLQGLFEDALHINLSGLERHGIHVEREFEELPSIKVDRRRILQILVNLISNAKHAVKVNDSGDRVLILRLEVEDEGRSVKFVVQDNGMGIPKENLARIFAHGFTTRSDGHGFGLHSCAISADQMDGSVQVCSDGPGTGATFTLTLPLEPAEACA